MCLLEDACPLCLEVTKSQKDENVFQYMEPIVNINRKSFSCTHTNLEYIRGALLDDYSQHQPAPNPRWFHSSFHQPPSVLVTNAGPSPSSNGQ
jgi:hypothetical protein